MGAVSWRGKEGSTSFERAHWFDILSSSLVRESHRRGLLRAAGILGAGFVFGDIVRAKAAAKKKTKKKQKSKKNRPKSPPPPPCSGGACAAEPKWAGNQAEIDHCEFICRQCDGDDARDFCIIEDFDGHEGNKVAVCCGEEQKCCDGKNCCDRDAQCCGNGNCCGSPPDFQCCNGACINTKLSPNHCGACGNACGDGQECINGRCGCLLNCPQGQPCIHNDGSFCVERPNRTDCHCGCPPGYKYCKDHFGGACVSENSPVC